MRWTNHILEQIKPHHFLKAIIEPKRAIRELKYRYTFSSAPSFCAYLTRTDKKSIKSLFDECHEQVCFNEAQYKLRQLRPSSGRGEMGQEAETLYIMVRLLKPNIMIETGVGAGISSTYILRAMQLNGQGRLYSIDLPDATGLSGWAVPDQLRQYWDLSLGSSRDLLPSLLRKTGPIDIFLHDSDHSYEHMMFEFRMMWPYLREDGLFLAHDIGRNNALFDFCKEVGISFTKVRTFPVLGGFRKPRNALAENGRK